MVVDSTDRARIGIVKVSCRSGAVRFAVRLYRLCPARMFRQLHRLMVPDPGFA